MQSFHAVPLSAGVAAASRIETDLLAVPVFERDTLEDLAGLDAASGGEISRVLENGELTNRPFDYLVVPLACGGYAARRALLVFAGKREDFGSDAARRVGALAGTVARQRRSPRLALLLRDHDRGAESACDVGRLIQAAAEGVTLSDLDTAPYKTGNPDLVKLERAVVNWSANGLARVDVADIEAAARRGHLLGHATNQARALGNEPSNVLTPTALARAAQELAEGVGLRVDVLDEQQIAAAGMGLLMGVARGSAEPPRVIVLTHDPVDAPARPVLGLVGKGITFDSGGISIKPADGMERMKVDMAGGAAVIAAMRAIAALKIPMRVIGVVASTENMPGGRALKPGDILRSAAGKTVEVVNTDAEGRLVLGDALWYARTLGATHLVDLATLTGAIAVALGRHASGLFARPDGWRAALQRAAAVAGDRVWPMPLYEEYLEQLKSDVADLMNTGGRLGGAATGAMFLEQFTGGLPWAHLDIAATAWVDEAKPWQPKGASGVGVRTLVELALNSAEWADVQ